MTATEQSVPKRRSVILLLILFVPAFLVLIGLGTWQVQRLAWKQALIEVVETRRTLPPQPAPGPADWDSIDLGAEEYRSVAVEGRFDHDAEKHLYFPLTAPKGPLGGPGVMVFTPLETTDGWWVLVNRGFVPDSRRDTGLRSDGQIPGTVRVTGPLRRFETRGNLNPAPDADDNLYFIRDRADLVAGLDLPAARLAPYYIDADARTTPAGGVPQGGETRITFTNNHLQYAITWYGLAAALAGVAIALLRRPRS